MLKRIALDLIVPNADQPRKIFDAAELADLAESIAANGLQQPITVRPVDGGRYEIVMGERRWRAHKLLAETGRLPEASVLAHVKRMDETQRDIHAIVENLQRKDISPLEEARAFQRMLDRGMTAQELADRVGRQVWRIEERTRLLALNPTLLRLYEGGQLSQEAASEIARITDHKAQDRVARLVASGQVRGYRAIRGAVDAVLGIVEQEALFGDLPAAPTPEDTKAITAMEAKVDQIIAMVNRGWKDGECVVAMKVSPDRARLMADKLDTIQKMLRIMSADLRSTAAKGAIFLQAAE